MRKCLRCGTEMKENCAIKVEGAGYGIVMSSDENKLFGGRIGKPKVAICPKCGEVSIYIEDVEKLYLYAWKNELKGITIFRDGCKRMGILTTESSQKEENDDMLNSNQS